MKTPEKPDLCRFWVYRGGCHTALMFGEGPETRNNIAMLYGGPNFTGSNDPERFDQVAALLNEASSETRYQAWKRMKRVERDMATTRVS